jgi:hypothetical protein
VFDLTTVKELIAKLRRSDPKHALFGAIGHQYQFETPLSEAKLAAWERERGIELPGDYRTYLRELGNGGAGPSYGIFPLGTWDGSGAKLESWDASVGDLAAKFPHRVAWNLPRARLTPPEEFEDDDEEGAWNTALDAEYYERSLLDGAFYICHHGCALRTVLVVTGPERGNVWFDGRPDDTGLVPHTDQHGRHLSFAEWYLAWLHDSARATS